MHSTKGTGVVLSVSASLAVGVGLGLLLNQSDFLKSPDLVPSALLCAGSLAIIFSPRSVRYGFMSPLAVVPAAYLVSLGLPSLGHALGLYNNGDQFGLEAGYIGTVNYYALGVLAFFYLGYLLGDPGVLKKQFSGIPATTGPPDTAEVNCSRLSPETTAVTRNELRGSLLCVVALCSFFCSHYALNRLGLLQGDILRGTGQWNPWGADNYLAQLGYAGLLMSTLTAGTIRGWCAQKKLWLAPVLLSIYSATFGSRGTLLPFVLFWLASAMASRKPSNKKTMVLAGFLVVLSAVFITQSRSPYFGLLNFVESLGRAAGNVGSLNPLAGVSSLEVTTAVFRISPAADHANTVAEVWRLVTPLPSFVVHQDIGLTNLMPYLGTYGGNTGTPFPLLGELFFFFGKAGVLFGLLGGVGFSRLFRICLSTRSSLLWPLIYTACVFGVIVSLHSGLRSVTRYPIWAVVWFLLFAGLARLVESALAGLGDISVVKSTQRAV